MPSLCSGRPVLHFFYAFWDPILKVIFKNILNTSSSHPIHNVGIPSDLQRFCPVCDAWMMTFGPCAPCRSSKRERLLGKVRCALRVVRAGALAGVEPVRCESRSYHRDHPQAQAAKKASTSSHPIGCKLAVSRLFAIAVMDRDFWMQQCIAARSRSTSELQQANRICCSVAVSGTLWFLCCARIER